MYSEISSLHLITEIQSLAARVPEARPRNSVIEGGFPHSEIRGSKLVRSSPRLIAAYHVLHRLSAPRHPPNALKSLDRSHHQCPSRSAADRSSVLANGSIGRTLIRKTSLLRIVPTACGQAADIALLYAIPSPQRLSSPCDVITFQCSELRAGRDITSRSTLGAILPLHDVRYHASHTKPRGFPVDAKDVLADEPKTPAGGARRDRTDDLLLAKQALSQLSYGPSGEQ